MVKKEISYIGLVKVMMAKARKDNGNSGKAIDTKTVFGQAAARWKKVKDGSDQEYSQGKSTPRERKTAKKTKSKKEPSLNTTIDLSKVNLTKLNVCDDCKTKIKNYTLKTTKKK